MASQTPRARRATIFLSLLGSASLAVMANNGALAAEPGAPAAAPVAAPAAPAPSPVEEVLITGSLIRGAPAVGVPVTALGEEEFREAGAITISDMLRNVPVFEVDESVGTVTTAGSNRQRLQNATIHGIGGQSTATLLMVNGKRYPAQGTNLENVDPSIIPPLAIQRIDILAAGASATYGSDAVAGVVNIITRRNYNGAITTASIRMSTDLGYESRRWQASQLFGRNWDTLADLGPGGITLTYEWWDQRPVLGNGRPYYTTDFEPFGFDDRTFLGSAIPGIVSTGNPTSNEALPATRASGAALSASTGNRYCDNCYSVPQGSGWNFGDQPPGPTTSWAQLLSNPGVNNLISPYAFGWMNPAQQLNQAVLAFDQQLLEDFLGLGSVSFFADAFYMQRRSQNAYLPGYSPCARCLTVANGATVPTNNPYRPSGVPAGTTIRAHFSLANQWIPKTDAGSLSGQYVFGLNFDELPFEWRGSIFFSTSEETSWARTKNMVNVNMFNAALGNTIGSQAASGTAPLHAAFTKPASVPFLNPFCDSLVYQCNAPETLRYLGAYRDDNSEYQQREFGANIDGPVFDLPGGTVRVALGAQKLTQHFFFRNETNENTFHTEIVQDSRQYNKQLSWAVFGQVNIPVINPDMNIPLVEELLFELGYRYDEYYELGGVKTPKIQGNWNIGYGLVARAAYGESFNAPPFGLISNYSGVRETHEMINVPGSRADTVALNCPAVPAVGIPQGSAQPGSLQAYLNPQRFGCPGGPSDPGNVNNFNSLSQPVGINIGSSLLFLQGVQLQPETSQQWSVGFNFAPAADHAYVGFLSGLVVDVSYWHIQRENLIGNIQPGAGNATQAVNNPDAFDPNTPDDPFQTRYVVAPRPDLLTTAPENASFLAYINEIIATGKAAFDPAAIPFVKFIDVTSIGNRGWEELAGIDFDIRYDWDLGNWGAWSAGMSGYYETRNRSQGLPENPISNDYTARQRDTGLLEGQNSGHQLQRARFRLGWTDGSLSIVGGANWRPHYFGNATVPPACFWHRDFGPGNPASTAYGGLCFPGAPYYPQPEFTTPPGHVGVADQRWGGQLQPSQVFFDLNFSYDTGDMPTNTYAQNIRVSLSINNLLNRLPSAINYDPRTSSGSARIREGNDFQRTVHLAVTKTW